MKLRTLIRIVTGTAVGLLAPTAISATGKAPTRRHRSDLKAVKHTAKGSKVAPAVASQGIYSAPFPSYAITTPRYIYVPANAANTPVVVDDCENYGNNCSDQELCDIWGLNCPAPPPSVAARS